MPLLGGALVVAGFSFMMWARIFFTSRNTTLFVGTLSSQLVCDGPFRFSRNPMYVGVLVSLLGIALWVGTMPMYVAVPFAFLTFNFLHIPREEQMLYELFGERYCAYLKDVAGGGVVGGKRFSRRGVEPSTTDQHLARCADKRSDLFV